MAGWRLKWLVDKIASFVQTKSSLRKLGYKEIFNSSPSIEVIELKNQDIVIVGSDGRDDIWMTNQNGERWMNDDENKPTLHDLAAEYNVSAERIRQIEVQAMKKIKAVLIA